MTPKLIPEGTYSATLLFMEPGQQRGVKGTFTILAKFQLSTEDVVIHHFHGGLEVLQLLFQLRNNLIGKPFEVHIKHVVHKDMMLMSTRVRLLEVRP